ncbi:hypothetical protein LY90DRAFT_499341 [Neocallimastix californiae]|uniref:Uncharacterized protein n=1 Tax=Neocallimastix californiae TaxID=1754190 RepID=A0A1Y2FN20_9FUNG|nr:hypothetical protein LY90DRAFT_499341 [Neocallimastix californiae]|eukprot:ORY84616.1 hypothetical protein LY90DRAFT_499341 [Neocallimastix californiae]
MRLSVFSIVSLVLGSALAKDDYFGEIDNRAELFKITDFEVPDITINFSDEDYKNFFLTYQCHYDTSRQHLTRNDECYSAPWVNLNNAIARAFNKGYIDRNAITDPNDLDLIESKNMTITDFEHIVTTYTNSTLETMFARTSPKSQRLNFLLEVNIPPTFLN